MFDWTASLHQPLPWIMLIRRRPPTQRRLLKCLAGQHCQFSAAKLIRWFCGQSAVRTGGRFRLRFGQGLVARTGVHDCAEQSEHRSD